MEGGVHQLHDLRQGLTRAHRDEKHAMQHVNGYIVPSAV